MMNMDDDDPIAVNIMLKYFYSGKYHEPSADMRDGRSQLYFQVLTYILADKYDIPDLLLVVMKVFQSTLESKPTAAEFLMTVSNVYMMIPRPANAMRSMAVDYARSNIQELSENANVNILRATLQNVPEFTFDLIQHFANNPLRGKCSSCGPNQPAEGIRARCHTCGKGGLSLGH